MKKSELSSGMRIKYRGSPVEKNTGYRIYLETSEIHGFFLSSGFIDIRNFNDDLTCTIKKSYDIVAIYATPYDVDFMNHKTSGRLLWEREENIPEYTMEEAIKKVGHEFKIKK